MVIGIDASRANLPQPTGTERYSLEIIKAIAKLDSTDRIILYVQTPPQPWLLGLGPNVEIRTLNWPPKLLWSQLRLSWEMLWRRPDVLFVPAHTIPLIHPGRTVVTLHDLGFEHFPELYAHTLIGGEGIVSHGLNLLVRLLTLGRYGTNERDYHRWSARLAVKRASSIIAISEYTRQDLMHRYHALSERIKVVYHGFDSAAFQTASPQQVDEIRKRFSLSKPYFLFIGRLERKKNIVNLIQAFSEARQHHDLELVLVGSPGTGWDEAQDLINKLDLATYIHVLGWQPTDIYVQLLSGATALVFCTHFEGFGLPIIEAFSVGAPVIASNVTSIPEIAGPAALLVNPNRPEEIATAMSRLVTNKTLRQELVAAGRERLKLFNWDQAGRETLEVLRDGSRDSHRLRK